MRKNILPAINGFVLLSDFFLFLYEATIIATTTISKITRDNENDFEKNGTKIQNASEIKKNILYLTNPSHCLI